MRLPLRWKGGTLDLTSRRTCGLNVAAVLRRILFGAAAVGLLLLIYMMLLAGSDPVVRHARFTLPGWPAGQPPLRIVLLSDLHVSGPDTPPSRIARIVGQVNRLHPDIVMLGGDFTSTHKLRTRSYTIEEAIAPLAGLRPRIASVAVMGNHESHSDAPAARAALGRQGVIVLDNRAVELGPLAVGGVNDGITGRADVPRTVAAMKQLGGVRILLSHTPDIFPQVPRDVPLTLAGHLHCGQIVLPLIGAPFAPSRYGRRYLCGIVREGDRTLIVTAGIGTSVVPMRLGAPPDLWVIDMGGDASPVG